MRFGACPKRLLLKLNLQLLLPGYCFFALMFTLALYDRQLLTQLIYLFLQLHILLVQLLFRFGYAGGGIFLELRQLLCAYALV